MHPVLFQLGPLKLYSYGVLVLLGFAAALWWSVRSGARRGFDAETIMDAGMYIFLTGIVFARLLYVALNLSEYRHIQEVLMVWQGGMSFHGGLLGGVLGGLFFCWRRGCSPWALADVVAPGVALAYGIGRIGCLLNGCCYGGPAAVPWAMRFPDLGHPGGLTPPSHPAMLYSSLAGFAMFAILAAWDRRRTFEGETFVAFLLLYCLYRFLLEFTRAGVTGRLLWGGWTEAQAASVLIAMAALGVGAWRARALAPTPKARTAT